jgi:aryl-alcohol dehydrogenase-like predicted oxidoreductase
VEQRTLAGTDLTVGRVVFGTMTFGSQVDLGEAATMVERCREAGVTMFDTSNNYNGGASEEMLGRILNAQGDDALVATKVGNRIGDRADERGLSKAAIHRAVDESLRRLDRDHIDVYYLHRPDRDTPIEESMEALSEVVEAGKVRHAAQSNYAAWQITELHCLAARHGWPRLRISQPMYNLIARRIEDEYVAASERLDLFDITYNPLAGGLLTGKHQPTSQPRAGTRFSGPQYRERYWNPQQFVAVERLRGIAADAGMTLIELSLRWLFAQPHVDAVLLGASSFEQLESNLAALDGPLPDDDTMRRCDEVWSSLHGVAPGYNR